MAIDFPDSPDVDDVHTDGSRSWVWDGEKWNVQAPTGSTGATGATGPQGPQGETGPQGPAGSVSSYSIVGSFNGAGSPLTEGETCLVRINRSLTITGWTILNDVSGSITYDIWVDSYANYPPTDADSIVASAAPAVSSALKNASTSLTGWTTSLSEGDVVVFALDTVDGVVGVSQLILDVDVV